MPTYLQGLTIGLAYVAPIGMQNLFVINSALTQPRRRALLTALIVIAFDISLALACFFGIGALVERFDWLQRLILIVGGCIVVWIGIGLLRDKPTLDRDVDVSIPLPKLAAKAFVVTWINPQALIDGTMLFGSFRAGNPGAVASQLMLGSASASCLWFLGITILISFFSAKFNDKILFATGKSDLSDASRSALGKFAASLAQSPETDIAIYGHTDNTGSRAVNQKLSEERAQAVANYLIGQKVDPVRITTRGLAYDSPIADNSTEEGRAQNRRVEILITANDQMIQQAQDGTLK